MKSWRRVPPALHSTPACFEPSSGCGSFEGRQRGPLSAFEPTLSLGSRAPVLRNRTRAGSCFGRTLDRRERRSEPAALEENSNQFAQTKHGFAQGTAPRGEAVTTKRVKGWWRVPPILHPTPACFKVSCESAADCESAAEPGCESAADCESAAEPTGVELAQKVAARAAAAGAAADARADTDLGLAGAGVAEPDTGRARASAASRTGVSVGPSRLPWRRPPTKCADEAWLRAVVPFRWSAW